MFEYIGRPTDPKMLAIRPTSPTVITGGDESRSKPMTARSSPSQRELAARDEREVPPTLRPVSGQPAAVSQPAQSSGVAGTFTRIDGSNAGRVVALRGDQLTIGRDPGADLHLSEETVSQYHARVCWRDGVCLLEDLGSQNGTLVWGKLISVVELGQGDLIRVGPTATLRFCWMDEHQQELLERLYESSVCDALTGAFNRRHFAERLESDFAYARRHRSELSLLVVDIDHFKTINERFGHPEEDRVLRDVTLACQRRLRTEDVFARYGGEEFAVLLRGVSLGGAARAAERLREGIAERVFVGDPPAAVSVSIGCASVACLGHASAGELIRLADRRLYEAKQSGRGRVVDRGFAGDR